MAVFTEADRKSVLEYIISFAKQNEHIIALVAVGSGAVGYVDQFSDIDLVVALDKDENMDAVMGYVTAQLRKRLRFIYFKQMPQSRLQVFLSDNYLEIDIGYGAYTRAAAHRERWKVLFDKSGTVDAAMRDYWNKNKLDPKTDEHDRKLRVCANAVWSHLMHAAVAIKRMQFWRAFAELECARNLYIPLLGCQYSLDMERGRDLDKLPEIELNVLKKTLVTSFLQEDLWRNLTVLTNAVYTELERHGERAGVRVNRYQVNEFINACFHAVN